MAERPKKAPRDEHLGGTGTQVRFILWLVGPLGGLGFLVWLFVPGAMGAVGAAFFMAACASLLMYFASLGVQEGIAGPVARGFGRLLMPSGSSTPSAKPLSHIEAMVARGELAKAADAYQEEIASDPADVASCERLALLALRQLRDYELALWAYREAERRTDVPGRKFGFGLLAANVCRDQLKDRHRTVVELRRLVRQYPTAPRVAALRKEIEELKAGMFEEEPRD
jgi:tetratricopeptide (TPR) repeat protein